MINTLYKVYKFALLALAIGITYSCGKNKHLPKLETKVNNIIQQMDEEKVSYIVFDTIDSFNWDELIVAGPYAPIESIKGYDLSAINTISLSHEKFMFFGFIRNKRGITYIAPERSDKILQKLLKISNTGFQIYPKSETAFIFERD